MSEWKWYEQYERTNRLKDEMALQNAVVFWWKQVVSQGEKETEKRKKEIRIKLEKENKHKGGKAEDYLGAECIIVPSVPDI